MRLPISRCGLVAVLALCSLCCATGCRSGAWGWPSSSSNWLSWKNWGKSADTTALASKPTTTAPKPSTAATPQPTTSIAAGTGVSSPAASTTASSASTASAAYPTTSQGYASPYATQPASAYQPAGAANQVQPSVGYQTGPYNVNPSRPTTTAAAGASGGYSQPAATTWNQDASGGYGAGSTSAPSYSGQGYGANPSPGGYATAAPSGDYRTADGRSMYGTQEASPYSTDSAQQNNYGAGSYGSGSYNQPAASGANGGYSAPAASPGTGTAPAPTTNPWNNYQAPAPNTYGAAPPAGGNTAGYGAAAAQPPASSYPAVPATLATSAGSYRPGSTAAAGDGVQNAAYTQPASGPSASGTINYGNSYLR